jgi:hypothetical protein
MCSKTLKESETVKTSSIAFVTAVLLISTNTSKVYVSFQSRNESTHGTWIFSVIMKSFIFENGYQIMFIFRIKANGRIGKLVSNCR